MKTARNLTFLDETQELINIYDHNPDENNLYPTPFQWPDNAPVIQQQPKQPSRTDDINHITKDRNSQPVQSPAASQRLSVSGRPGAPQYPWPESNTSSQPQSASEKHAYPSQSPANSHTYSDRLTSATSLNEQSLPKRRRLTFEGSYQSSVTSSSPGNQFVLSPSDSWHTGWTPASNIDNIPSNSDIDLSSYSGLESNVSQSLSRIYLETPIWPLKVIGLSSTV